MEEVKKILDLYTPALLPNSAQAIKQYNPETHDVFDPNIRKQKEIEKPLIGADGKQMVDDEGNELFTTSWVEVNRVAIPMQKLITNLRKYFMNLKGAQLVTENDDSVLLEAVKRVYMKNKYTYEIEDIAKRVMSELQGAEMWWLSKEGEIKMAVLSPEKGDLMMPIFDEYRDMKYFIRLYSVIDMYTNTSEQLTDVFTADYNYTFNSKNDLVKEVPNKWGKIPIIYYTQDKPEWSDVQVIIDRFEKLISNFGDTNDYNGAPITVVKGEIEGFTQKEQAGKTVQVGKDADLNYLTWDSAPEAIKLELDTLYRLMHSFSHTPDISMEALKGQGLSGVAFDRVFIDAQLSAEEKLSGDFGKSMQRSVNLVTAMCRSIDSSFPDEYISIELESYKFDDLESFVKNMTQSESILSNESRTKMLANKYGLNEKDEWERVQKENNLLSIEGAEL